MQATTSPTVQSALRKLQPRVKPPVASVLRALTADDRRLLERRLVEPAECVLDPAFAQPGAADQFANAVTMLPLRRRARVNSDDSGVDLLAVPSAPLISSENEQRLFLQINYARYRVMKLLKRFQDKRLTAEATHELLRWERLVVQTRAEIVRANVPLVLAMAKRTKISGVDFSDLISEGNLALLRSVDKFDCARGFKFSTYACRAILKSFSRVAARTARHRGHFPTEFDPMLERSDFADQRREGVEMDCVDELKAILGRNLANLNEIEAQVIKARFALDEPRDTPDPTRAKTLEQVGEMIGVTKERVRQIQNKALSKLRSVLEEGILAS